MQLQDFENAVLSQLQEANVSFGAQPTYASGANYAQATLDWAINRGYAWAVNTLGDIQLLTETITFPSANGQYSYPVPVGQAASAQVSTKLGTGPVTGVVLTITINGTPVTYTCVSTDGALSALAALVQNVNTNATLVTGSSPVITPMQIYLNATSAYTVMAFSPGTAGNSITLTVSSSNSTAIAITATGSTLSGGTAQSPNIRMVRSLYYQPLGFTYNLQREPGVRFLSWAQYQRKIASGYLQYFSAGTQPDYAAMNVERTRLHVYPTPYTNGDTMTLQYAPQLTNSANVPATNWGYLVNSTDSPPTQFPEDAQDAIWMYACFLMWPKSRELGTAQMYLKMAKDKLAEMTADYLRASEGDKLQLVSRDDALVSSYGNL